jgi:peptide/nickel transport system substrate-binding protein
MRRASMMIVTLVTALIFTACTSEAEDATTTSGEGGPVATTTPGDTTTSDAPDEETVFRMVVSTDPGSLDPQLSAAANLGLIGAFAYDSLVSVNPEDGSIQSALASDWSVDGTEVVFTLSEGITCSDGSPLTATDIVANFDFVGNPENQSPFFGVSYPAGATAVADDDAGTITMTLAGPAPFVLNALAGLPIVCAAGMEDREALTAGTAGTGPYLLSDVQPGSTYTFTKRDGYTWGPDGAGTDVEGMPDVVEFQVVENESTAANLLLAGDVNAATILGEDTQRLVDEGLFFAEGSVLIGEMWFNHGEGRPAAEVAVRQALTQGIDLDQVQGVMTAGGGGPATSFAVLEPAACPGDSVAPGLSPFDPDAAGVLLDEAGWTLGDDGIRSQDGQPLTVTFLHDTSLGPAAEAAAELATQQWSELGVSVVDKPQTGDATNETLFATGDWDIAWIPINVTSPDQLVPFLSGPGVTEGGLNFASIQNADYEAAMATAMEVPGVDGCSDWLAAETALVAGSDVVPFANSSVKTFGNGAEFEAAAGIIPTSVRLTG